MKKDITFEIFTNRLELYIDQLSPHMELRTNIELRTNFDESQFEEDVGKKIAEDILYFFTGELQLYHLAAGKIL
jgi:hypothetical protein